MKQCIKCGEPLKDDAVFCTKCGANQQVENNCPKCGAKLKAGANFCPKCGTKIEASAENPSFKHNAQANDSDQSNRSLKIIIAILIAIIVVGTISGVYYHKTSQNNTNEPIVTSSSSEIISSDTSSSSEEPKQIETKPVAKDNLTQAREILESKNFEFGIKAVSNITDDGFLAYTSTEGRAFIVYDKIDDVITIIKFDKILLNIKNGRSEDYILLTLYKERDTATRDSRMGYWQDDGKHIFSVWSGYKIDGNGNVIPGMLTSAEGKNPSHYQSYLNEPQNVNIVNIALTHADSLRQDMQARNIQY